MACSTIGISPRTYLSPPSVPLLSGFTPWRTGASNGSLSSRNFSFYRGRKGFFGESGLYSLSKGFHLKASSSCYRRPTYLRAYSRLGGFQKKSFRPESPSYPADLHSTAEPIRFRQLGKMGLSRRGLKRTLSARSNQSCGARAACYGQSRWKEQNLIGNTSSSKMTPVASSRKKFRCWNQEGDAGEPPPADDAALEALEQTIQYQVKEETRLFFGGPARGDLAEYEAFCRLYRVAEQLHSSVMDALRTHSTNANLDGNKNLGPYRGDVLEVEERVATCLARLMAILHEGKSEVLGLTQKEKGNVIEEDVLSDDLPPFARIRKEVRASCLVLEDALGALLPGDSQQGMATSVKVQRLKNACLDAGFPRPEGIPSPADIPNLAPVRLRPSKSARTLYKDDRVAFWRGGQLTEAGLAWLVERGFKTIVDIREGSAPDIAQSGLPEIVASGNLKVVRMPVESRGVPSQEQVEEFARLVADPENKPLYLHTKAGVGRASAMVHGWRQILLRKQLLQAGANLKTGSASEEGTDPELLNVADALRISQEDALALVGAMQKSQNGHFPTSENASSIRDPSVYTSSDEESDDDLNTLRPNNNKALAPASIAGRDGQATDRPLNVTKNAFEAQRPRNVLSRKAMSKFMKRRKASSVSLQSSSSTGGLGFVNGSIAGPANRWTPNSGLPRGDGSKGQPRPPSGASSSSTMNGSYDKTSVKTDGNARLESVNGHAGEGSIESPPTERENGSFYKAPGDINPTYDSDDSDSVQGDMCASTTGVVRLQSRKKAEMFLVRTDGYSCTRERVRESTLAFSHPSTQQQMLMWKTPPRTVLVLKKLGKELIEQTEEVASYLYHQEGMNVMVEPDVHDVLARKPEYGFIQTFHVQDTSELHERVDFVVCLGGDGVILHASNLFRSAVPPVVSFNLGSLGFLTSHNFETHTEDLQAVIHGRNDMITGVYITLRMRLRCELFRNGKAVPGKIFDVLNEVVVDRGSNPYLCKIECYERNRLITKVQADGVIVATPTGSTAYSIAAGGSMVHPNVPCMLFTPICPHSLSFRPVILPDSALLELKVPPDARSNAWVSFDGKKRQQMSKGDSIRISMSEHPLPTVNKSDQTDDWFQSLVRCLNWNERLEQRPLSS